MLFSIDQTLNKPNPKCLLSSVCMYMEDGLGGFVYLLNVSMPQFIIH